MFKWKWNEELKCYCTKHNATIRADRNGNVFGGGTTKIESGGTTTPQPTEAEREMQELQLGQYKRTVGPQTELQLQGMDLISKLFAGGSLPGYFGEMAGGISPEAIGAQATELTRTNMPGFQKLGIAEGGVPFAELSKSIANQLLFPAEQFNIGAKQNLLNLALSGQAQVQQPITAQTGILSQQLAGLRPVSTTGQQTTNYGFFANPFIAGIGQGLGSGFGQAAYGKLFRPTIV